MGRGWFGGNAWRGSKWIARRKRHLIYERDGWQCLWCSETVEFNVDATLDHYEPRVLGGCNAAANVFTCCYECNCDRGDLLASEYAATLEDGRRILARILRQLARPIDYLEPKPWQLLLDEAVKRFRAFIV